MDHYLIKNKFILYSHERKGLSFKQFINICFICTFITCFPWFKLISSENLKILFISIF